MTALFILPTTMSLHAEAQLDDIKKMLLMPGPLIEAHAEEEDLCNSCHTSFDKGAQDSLCLDCHEDVEADQTNREGFHGLTKTVLKSSCKSCHSDHKGRSFNNVPLDPDTFDHNQTDFHLTGQHQLLSCPACHEPDQKPRETEGQCSSCHTDDNPHDTSMGDDCAGCHTTDNWLGENNFDHSTTDFPLRGKHQSQSCASCHSGERYEFESTECVTCHALTDAHKGRLGGTCSDCHNEEAWSDTQFNHDTDTHFALTGAHAEATCSTCHHDSRIKLEPQATCNDCHATQDTHGRRHGQDCADCHSTMRWQVKAFDHEKIGGWALPDGHEELSCLQCHPGELDDQEGKRCRDCHETDDVHASTEGQSCALCHESQQWQGASGFNHELTSFPLEGMHAIAPCATCHESHQYTNTSADCVACHRSEDTHNAALGENCGQCHTPNGWNLWLFDHERDADFVLTQPHENLSCTACHQNTDSTPPQSCGGCHEEDDRHDGAFGSNCDSCHKGSSFGEITWPR